MAAQPADYPWSSHGANAGYRDDTLLAPLPEYFALGADRPSRTAVYRALFADALSEDVVAGI